MMLVEFYYSNSCQQGRLLITIYTNSWKFSDNAVIENFFGLLKSELLYLQRFESMEHFKKEPVDYLDYYNNRRSKAKLNGFLPALHRQQVLSAT